MKKRRVNPRRIPLPKSKIDSETILDEATKDDIYRAWLLVGNAILELDLIPSDALPQLVNKVNQYIAEPSDDAKRTAEMLRAERTMGIPIPAKRLNPQDVHSEAELKSFKKKVYRLATFTALCVLYLALEKSSFFDEQKLSRVFLNVNVAMAEIESGINSYGQLEKELGKYLHILPTGE